MASSHVVLLALLTFQLAATLSQGLAVVDNEKDALTLLKIKEQFGNPAALGPWRNGTDHCTWWISARSATSTAASSTSSSAAATSPPRSPRLSVSSTSCRPSTSSIPARLVRGGTANSPAALTLSNNRLTGKIPWTYAVENNLIQLWVANNRLVGDASFLFGRRKAMVYMDLSGNKLRFNLTGVEMPEGLQVLNLARNRIYGRVPATLRESKVVALDLSYNELCGEIPTGGQMVRFEAAPYVHNKCLCGTPLPSC
ncbi:hypothetical protein ACQ4PT_003674 [Festuca glaucescens]